jgi:signal transduction histidine kinase/ligand-binding sensor domain-containing protein/DNA-binding response OmpR family regulator
VASSEKQPLLNNTLLSLFILFVLNSQSFSQYKKPSFNHLTVEDGLSQSTIFAITQDHKGFIWIGTRDGLNRYDSHDIKIYRSVSGDPNSLVYNVITSLLTDSKGQLWVGTSMGACLYHYDKDNFTRILNVSGETSSLSSNNVTVIYEDRHKNIWIGTRGGLDLVVSQSPLKMKQFFHNPGDSRSLANNYVRAIYQDDYGDIWVGTVNGLSRFRWDNKNSGKLNCKQFSEADTHTLSDNWINAITGDENGTIWIGTEKGGLTIYDRKTNQFYSRRHKGSDDIYQKLFTTIESVRVINKDKNNQYWIGTMSGLFLFDPFRKQWKEFLSNPDNPSSLSDNSVRTIFIDRNDSKWIGTFYGGVDFYSSISNQFDHFRQMGKNSPLRFKMASAFYEDDQNNLWLSIDGGGIIFWDRKKNTFETYKHKVDDPSSLSHDNVKCIFPDKHEGLWIGTFNGLNYLSFRTKKIVRYFSQPGNPATIPNDRIYDIKADKDGNIWIATNGGGLCKYNKKESRFESRHFNGTLPNEPNSDLLTSLHFDSKGRLWIGTSLGLNVQFANGTFWHFNRTSKNKESLDGKYILFIHEDRQKHIWVGTRGNGLFSFNEKDKDFSQLTIDDGLPGNEIYGFLEDDNGFLWLSTENGISKFDAVNKKFKNYGKNDGLICKEFNFNSYMKDHAGTMYFGGYNGIVTFHPDSIVENPDVPPLSFTKLKLFNKDVEIGDAKGVLAKPISETRSLTFHYDQNVFSIEFAVLNYINPNKNQYAYRLDGFEEKWNFVNKPIATYMNLKPGTYTFLAKGSNNDGEWNETPISLTIKILPPPWKTWWAYLLYIGVIIAALMNFMKLMRVRLKLEQNLYLEQMENKKQNELHQAILHFFTNISHELRTPLTLIISPIDNLINMTSDVSVRRQLQVIHSNANRLLRLMNQLLDFRKHETKNLKLKVAEGNIVKFIQEIQLAFQEYARLKKIALEFESDSFDIKVWYDREELEKVFFNLLSNAFKFTPEGGKVTITMKELHSGSADGVEIVVEDNGIGIPQAHLDKIFDSFYQVKNHNLLNQGFGIGLALSKGIIELHHGNITINSIEAANGMPGMTRFTIFLRFGNAHFEKTEIVHDFKTSEQIDSYLSLEEDPLESLTDMEFPVNAKEPYALLVVEDNPEIRHYLKTRLRALFSITEASNGQEAWEIASTSLPDLIISDVMMPVMDGITLTNRLKSDERTSHIPIILVTARSTIVHQMEGLETGADEYITKPFNFNLLELKIRNLLITREKLKQKYSRIVSLEPKYEEISNPDEKFIQRLLSIVETHMVESEFNVAKLVAEIGMSRPVLFRKIKVLTGMSVIDLIRTTRLKKAAMLLKQKKMSIAEVGYAVGFSDSKYFSKAFRHHFGKSPTEFITEADHAE